MSEEWRPVVGFEGLYEVSDLGRVRSLERTVWSRTRDGKPLPRVQPAHVLAQAPHRAGYRMAHLYKEGTRTARTVHTLVADAFLGPCPAGQEVAHNDGVRSHNALVNLRYDTRAGNFADKVAHGTDNRGEKHPLRKLSEKEVRAIRCATGRSDDIGAEYGVSRSTVNAVQSRRTWRHVA